MSIHRTNHRPLARSVRIKVRPNDGTRKSGNILASALRGLAFAFFQTKVVEGATTDALMHKDGHILRFKDTKSAEAFINAAEAFFTEDFLDQVDIWQRFKRRALEES
ncbi:hypothetical protein [Roseomonas sp. CECT 9278]|uniref:hypothetical protein n=1 Tax=Roseomonas sp. CECT 9278 TaxID=2845823 RepID=UPI001E4BA3D3|nr:hypothetical protein [Roseomonas sp. CECT 9278]